jgi:RND family efflux transporter MFP subunit
VRAGQTLVRLDDEAARAEVKRTQAGIAASQHQVEVAKTQSALAASTLVRYQTLRDRKSVSPQEFDEVDRRAQAAAEEFEAAQAQLSAAQAGAVGARTAAGYSVISAPFAGIVTARHVDPGALAAPGAPLLDVDRSGELQLQVTVDESLLRDLKSGSGMETNIPSASATPLHGRVAEIVPAADSVSHTFLIKIDLPVSPNLRAGMYGAASVGKTMRSALAIPQAAVVTHGSLNSVWVLDSRHVASIRYITVGSSLGQNVEVLSGLADGESVVLSPGDRELGGRQIEVRQ